MKRKSQKKRTAIPETWNHWPKWNGDSAFQTPNFRFSCSVSDYCKKTQKDEIVILKDHGFIDIYRKLTAGGQVKNIFEIGFFQGGMPLFLADMISPKKIVAVDWNSRTESLKSVLDEHDLSNTIELIGGVDQENATKIREIVEAKFSEESLDLIIDDCSHYYDQTKICFESLFGYLRPGGKYVIEDWGWTHWPGEPWQTERSPFHKKTSMTNLIFEIVMALASNEKIISNIEVASQACVIVTRGKDLPHGMPISLKEIIHVAGGRKAELIAEGKRSLLAGLRLSN